MEFNRKNMVRIFFLFAAVILFYLGFKHMDIVFSFIGWLMGVLTPFIIAGVVIIILNVPLKLIERHLFRPRNGKPVSPRKEKLRRPLAIVLSISIFVVIIAVFLIIIIPEIAKSLQAIAEKIPGVISSLQEWLGDVSKNKDFFGQIASEVKANIEWDKLNQMLVDFLQQNSSALVSSAWTVITSVFNVALNLFLGIVLAVYILAKKEKIASVIKRILYSIFATKRADFLVGVGHLTNQSFYNSITGQMMECVIIGLLTALGMSVFGFPYAALGGVVVAITSWIPMFGIFIGSAIISLLLLATVGPVQAIWFIIYMVILQQIEGNLIFPRVVGSRIGLPPIILISAIVLFSAFFGIYGLLVCGPVTYVIYTLIKDFVSNRLAKKKVPAEKYDPVYDNTEEEERQRLKEKEAAKAEQKIFGININGKLNFDKLKNVKFGRKSDNETDSDGEESDDPDVQADTTDNADTEAAEGTQEAEGSTSDASEEKAEDTDSSDSDGKGVSDSSAKKAVSGTAGGSGNGAARQNGSRNRQGSGKKRR